MASIHIFFDGPEQEIYHNAIWANCIYHRWIIGAHKATRLCRFERHLIKPEWKSQERVPRAAVPRGRAHQPGKDKGHAWKLVVISEDVARSYRLSRF